MKWRKSEFICLVMSVATFFAVVMLRKYESIAAPALYVTNKAVTAAASSKSYWLAKEYIEREDYLDYKPLVDSGEVVSLEQNTFVKQLETVYAPQPAHRNESCAKVKIETGAYKDRELFVDEQDLSRAK
jgi:hypothetical protein